MCVGRLPPADSLPLPPRQRKYNLRAEARRRKGPKVLASHIEPTEALFGT